MVCEEAPDIRSYGARTKSKSRYVSGVVTPAQPNYLHGLVDDSADSQLNEAPPVLAVATAVGGYMVSQCLGA